jgi:mannitol-1-/sugar-/sorbitol-6-phosphatase
MAAGREREVMRIVERRPPSSADLRWSKGNLTPLTLTCRAILFDMDGTLVDSTRVVERAWACWARRHNIPLEDVLLFSHGRPSIATVNHFLPGRDHTAELNELQHYEETEFEGVVAVPGAIQVVNALQKHPWAMVTSAWRKLAVARVTAAELPLPTVIVPSDEIQNPKPNPEGFLRAAELLKVSPRECLVFEDTRPGIDAGLNAGMQVVGLLTTLPANQLRHSPLIQDFRDVEIRSEGDYLKVGIKETTSSPVIPTK